MIISLNREKFSSPFFQWLLIALFIVVATTAVAFYAHNSSRFTPSIHDELSYLFQARTFLAGRFTNPVHPEKLFFDQYHVINEGSYTSKYFPGTALTMLPAVALGQPYAAGIILYGLQLLLVFLIGQSLFGRQAAWLGMILTSFSPQIVLQTCFLLSHLPCAFYLLLFFYGFIRSQKNNPTIWILISGAGWTLAFLTRPLTAVSFAFPIAMIVLHQTLRRKIPKPKKTLLLWAIPILFALICYFSYNKTVTGNWLKTPFESYAEIHAPFHRYGFHTWDRYADQAEGPRVDQRFNQMYHNHTLTSGFWFAGIRLAFFIKFLFGEIRFFSYNIYMGFFALALWFWGLLRRDPNHFLILGIWLSVQLFHIPHWYPGILSFGSNYLYETTGLVLLAVSDVLIRKISSFKITRWKMILGSTFLILCLAGSYSSLKYRNEVILLSKTPFFWIHQEINKRNIEKAVIFVRYPPDHDLNTDVIDNTPSLNAWIIYARDRGKENLKLKKYYPGYVFYLWDYAEATLTPLKI
ncbi:MAG: glycosyltransferase family 39 protein [Candidatus Omnitrophica bacterium]|nr:glycosyltransferase family 39 protein [Candidatus Omnitrophota bacterium]